MCGFGRARGWIVRGTGRRSVVVVRRWPGRSRCVRTAVGRRLGAPMPPAKQLLDRGQQFLAPPPRDAIAERREKLHVANEMRPAELHHGRRFVQELAVGAVVIAADDAGKRLAQELPEHLGTAGGVDVIPGEAVRSRRMKAPCTTSPGSDAASIRPLGSCRYNSARCSTTSYSLSRSSTCCTTRNWLSGRQPWTGSDHS